MKARNVSASNSSYKVGPGRPPLHTRFQKGQSGNPSGKPGPAKLARQRFQRALFAALDGETAVLKSASPRSGLEALARRLALDAVGGDMGAARIILAEIDREIAQGDAEEGKKAERATAKARADEPPPVPDYALWVKMHGKG